MPRDSSGVYTLPDGYEAVTGETIQPSQHNPPLEDIASALTGSVPRNGTAPMLAALKLADGSASAPALAFNSQATTGFFKTTSGIGVAIAGVNVAEFSTGGLLASVPVGAGMDYWSDTAPPGWIFPYGQAISRTTFAALFAKLGTTYGAGDGSTTFNLPDKRARASFPKDDMGGSSAGRITNQSGGWNATLLGASGGAQTHTLTSGQMPAHSHGGVTGAAGSVVQITSVTPGSTVNVSPGVGPNAVTSLSTGTDPTGNHTHGIGSEGLDLAHNNLPPGIVCNYIIFTGVV